MRPAGLIPVLMVIGLPFFGLGCGTQKSCTLVGCADRLEIVLSPSFTGAYRVQLSLDGGAGDSFLCPAGALTGSGGLVLNCDENHIVIGAAPTKVSVTVKAEPAAGDAGPSTMPSDRTGAFTPTYTSSSPNGPDCQPTCRSGSVTLR